MFSFRKKNRYNSHYAKINPLQVQVQSSWKKTFSNASCPRGSLTVEAALALPLFLFVMIGIFSIGRMMHVEQEISRGLVGSAKELALNQLETAGIFLLDSKMKRYCDRDYLDRSCLASGMNGIRYLGSSYDEEEQCYYLRAGYACLVTIPLIGEIRVPFSQCVKQRAFTGYDWERGTRLDENAQYVYVTETGGVCHTSRECTHLMLSIQIRTDMGEDAPWRKEYHPCERCTRYETGTVTQVYVTEEGRKYHTSIECSGLKRTVIRKKKEETKRMRMCQRCGRAVAS